MNTNLSKRGYSFKDELTSRKVSKKDLTVKPFINGILRPPKPLYIVKV